MQHQDWPATRCKATFPDFRPPDATGYSASLACGDVMIWAMMVIHMNAT